MRKVLVGAMSAMAAWAAGSGTVSVKGHAFRAEVAETDAQKQQGLMYRAKLAPDACMIFLYDEDGNHGIWMKNCLISLDVAWVKEDGIVVETVENVPPCSPMLGNNCPTYGGKAKSRCFIEFASGTFKRIGLKKGDRIAWDLKLADGGAVKGGAGSKSKAR